MKALVVHCSRTGRTDALAREIAARCGADVERIRDVGVDRSGLLGNLRSGWQAWSERPRHARPQRRLLAHLAA